jgi:diguanylate cyclase (GGDEF)-like protein/PAS domain S-box-containing protein
VATTPLAARAVVVGLVYGAAYLVTAKVHPPQFFGVSAFWLPNAAILPLLLWSRRRDWGVYLPFAVLADSACSRYLWQSADWVSAAVATCNFGESALAAAVLLRLVGVPRMDHVRDVLVFVLVAGLAAPAVNTSVVTALLAVARELPAQFAEHFFIGDMTGMLVLGPALLAWSAPAPRPALAGLRRSTASRLEPVLVACALGAVTVGVFGRDATQREVLSPYLVLPVLVWAAVRLGPRAATAAIMATAAMTTAMTSFGRGPFADAALSVPERVAGLQLFFVSAALATLVLAAVEATSEQRHQELKRSEARFRTGFVASPIGLVFTDLEGRYRTVNPAFCELVGRDEADLLTKRFADVTHPEDAPADTAALERLRSGSDRTYRAEKRYVRPDGSVVWANVTVATLFDGSGRPESVFAQVVDVTARRQAEVVLARQATHDALTGLPNRRLFLELLRASLRRLERDPGTVAVLFLDVDRFKQVNDLHGHAAGDNLLIRIGRLVSEVVRPSDVTARHGGDEFTVLLDHLGDEGEAAVIAERILALLRVSTNGTPLDVSVGVAATTDPRLPPETLVAHADAAMYRAKSRGGGRWQMFDEVTYVTLMRRARTAEDLQEALAADQLELHYQPIVRLSDGGVAAVEALLRWRHPTRGLLEAAEFVDVLEHSPALGRISRWLVQRACMDLSSWRRDPTVVAPDHVHVNVVPRQLVAEDLVGLLESATLSVGLEPSAVCVEVTESAVADLEQAEEMLQQLRETGCLIALDDFGIGHSSLSRLAEWPVDQIKVDKSLVQRVTTVRGVALVTAAKRLAETLGCELVAEGVESQAQRGALRTLGFELVQGYLFSAAIPADAVPSYLRKTSEQADRALRGS